MLLNLVWTWAESKVPEKAEKLFLFKGFQVSAFGSFFCVRWLYKCQKCHLKRQFFQKIMQIGSWPKKGWEPLLYAVILVPSSVNTIVNGQ